MNELQHLVEIGFDQPDTPGSTNTLHAVFAQLESGELRVATRDQDGWTNHEWVKKAILLAFQLFPPALLNDDASSYFDRMPPRFHNFDADQFRALNTRVNPGAIARGGCFIGPSTVLMPSFVNVGAYLGEGTMVDTWTTVGSCAQIGNNVHLSGGSGIGGVLEPAQASPTIIEDNCFIGARPEVVEGIVVEEDSVIGMGVFIGQSTPIYDRGSGETTYGRVPSGSVIVSGTLSRGDYSLNAEIIVKTIDAQPRSKTSTTELLRGV
jgi:2,3,4,5-tetrahydropyridine-2-carboxylate N-succinyltransferase